MLPFYLRICHAGFLVFLMGGLISCNSLKHWSIALSNPPLVQVNQLPEQNRQTTVYLRGKVGNQAPFLGNAAYQLQDSTGTVWVLTNGKLPKPGEEVVIRGQVEYESIAIGGQDLGEVYILELEQISAQDQAQIQPQTQSPNPTPNLQPPAPSTQAQNQPQPVPSPQAKPTAPAGAKPNIEELLLPHKQYEKNPR
jgi:hypothetical protein